MGSSDGKKLRQVSVKESPDDKLLLKGLIDIGGNSCRSHKIKIKEIFKNIEGPLSLVRLHN
jgi:hypothetical protein